MHFIKNILEKSEVALLSKEFNSIEPHIYKIINGPHYDTSSRTMEILIDQIEGVENNMTEKGLKDYYQNLLLEGKKN